MCTGTSHAPAGLAINVYSYSLTSCAPLFTNHNSIDATTTTRHAAHIQHGCRFLSSTAGASTMDRVPRSKFEMHPYAGIPECSVVFLCCGSTRFLAISRCLSLTPPPHTHTHTRAHTHARMHLPTTHATSCSAPGPGNCAFEDATNDVCDHMEHNPNRFTAEDCRIGCCYEPTCMVWASGTNGGPDFAVSSVRLSTLFLLCLLPCICRGCANE
jgi:hypothetical protein